MSAEELDDRVAHFAVAAGVRAAHVEANILVQQVIAARERFGFSYICVLEPSMHALAPVIEILAGT